MPATIRPPVLLHSAHLPGDPSPPEGWKLIAGFELPEAPWDLSQRKLVAAGSIGTEVEAAAALEALTRGVGLVVQIGVEGDLRHRVLEDLHRLGDIRRAHPDSEGPRDLDDEDRALLDALSEGATVAEGARRLHISLRTANRRLASIRDRFEVTTTAEAVTRWVARRPSPGTGQNT